MRVRLLGGFGVDIGGHPVDGARWRLRKARTVVKLLALEPRQRLHRDQLLDLLWPDLPAPAAANNLHQALHAARRALTGGARPADPGVDRDGLLELRDQVVALRAGGLVEVDAVRFRELARAALDAPDVPGLLAARAAYRGELLPEDRYEPWAAGPREELRLLHRDVLVGLGGRLRAAGRPAEAVQALEGVLAQDPLHEPALRALLRALAEAGQRSTALLRYERARADLRAAHGTDPDPETVRLYRELLVGSLDPAEARRETAAPGAPAAARDNLSAAVTSFVGRERELAQVHRLLGRTRLLTLTGPGGAGKTRLAQVAARQELAALPGGAWFVDLVPVRDRHLVADSVATAIGLPPAAGLDPLRALVRQLAARRLVLILDNCEHLLPECGRVAAALLADCPGVSVLATSREPLHVEGEVVLRVPSLALPEPHGAPGLADLARLASVRLFLERAADFRPDFALERSNAAAVVEICRRLDGMPLAIELAAARVAHLEPAEIAERLGNALSVLGRTGTATRHATLRAALDWSHDLLDPAEQVLLRRLAVFEGGCTLAAAEQVCAGDPLPGAAVLDLLGRLVDKSLVQVDSGAGRSRFRLLETVRQFAEEKLRRCGESDRLRAAHGRYFAALAPDLDPDLPAGGGPSPASTAAPDAELDNLRAALRYALRAAPDEALRLAVGLWRFWVTRGHYVEGSDWLRRILAVAPDHGPARAEALRGLAVLEVRLGHIDVAVELADQAAALPALLAAPEPERLPARLFAGFLAWIAGDLDAADAAAAGVVEAAVRLDRPEFDAAGQWLAGMTALFREDTAAAEQALARCQDRLARVPAGTAPFFPAVSVVMTLMSVGPERVPVFEETALLGRLVGAAAAVGYARSALGAVHRYAGRPAAALESVRAAVRTFHGLGDPAGLALALNHLGCVERDLGDPAAAGHLVEALELREGLGDRRAATLTLANRGLAEAAAGDPDRGRASVRAALARVTAIDDRPGEAGVLLNLAVVELLAGEVHAAGALAADVVELSLLQGCRRLDALVLTLAARTATLDGDPATAGRYADRAGRLFAAMRCGPGQARAAAALSGR